MPKPKAQSETTLRCSDERCGSKNVHVVDSGIGADGRVIVGSYTIRCRECGRLGTARKEAQ